MPWYRTGTVAITAGQTTVTGTGTNFSANGRVGDALLGPDGNWYEVTNIASATVLSILPAYKGVTVAGGTYAIAPVQGYTKTLADKFNDIANTWGSTLAGLGAVSTENVVPMTKGGTGSTTAAGALAALGLTLPTANGTDSVTDFNALTSHGWQAKLYSQANANSPGALGNAAYYYVLNVVYGSNLTQIAIPYGSNAVNRGRICWRSLYQGGWLDWQKCLSQFDILGVASQAGGVPTGAIIERGSNANGEYVRYADGTQICWGLRTYSDGVGTAAGSAYISGSGAAITWPVPFSSATVALSAGVWSGSYRVTILPYRSNQNNGTVTFQFYASVPAGTDIGYVWMAVGRWY
ncbi:pyocin knob domain-containing protein [Pseudomonas putida]|uniref:pyocin knob domain-containing protein n=1 Tax=Pseudomonas putida TaxID=303 RepID=UPI00370B2081